MNVPQKLAYALEHYGNFVITGLVVRRDPLNTVLTRTLNVLSLGAFEKAQRELGYDKLFHLSLVIELKKPMGRKTQLFIEKNEVVNVDLGRAPDPKSEFAYPQTPVPPVTFRQFIQNAIDLKGDQLFVYDAFQNNCQDFIITLLRANNVLTPKVEEFVKQDAQAIAKRLPSFLPSAMRTITDIAASRQPVTPMQHAMHKHGMLPQDTKLIKSV